jgi:hypothetical protein
LNIPVQANQTTICTYTNTENPNETRGKIRVDKVTVPSGSSQSFTFTPSNFNSGSTFPLTDTATPFLSELLVPTADGGGSYDVSEGSVSGWSLTGLTCKLNDGAGATTGTVGALGVTGIAVEAGKVTLCTFTNTRDQGYFKIKKIFDAKTSGFAGNFTIHYDCGGTSSGDVQLAAGATSTAIGPFDTGTSCTITEPTLPSAPTGWTFGTPSISGSPLTIVKDTAATTTSLATVTNSITRDQGYFKIKKVFDAKTSGFVGSFTIHYNCGAGDQTVSLVAGATSAAIGPFDTGTQCSVSEPSLPSAPTGWTFGTPSVDISPVTIVKDTAATTTTLSTVTNSITRDQGYFKIKKVFDAKTSDFAGNLTVHYDCGGANNGDIQLAAGATSAAIGPFDTGTSCAVTEPSTPTAPTGWTFGTPSVDISPVIIVKNTAATTTTLSTVTNSITRDRGTFTIEKTVSNPDGATVPVSFTVNYNCGLDTDGSTISGQRSIAPGSPATVTAVPTGNTCSVTEVAPAAIPGFTWGTITYTPATIVIGDKVSMFKITVGNSITKDRGTLTIAKTLSNPDGASVPASFTVNYNCGLDTDGVTALTGSKSVAPGSPATVGGIPTGNTCTVTEVAPSAIPGFTWGTITYTPASIVIGDKVSEFKITVGNSITKDRGTLTIAKTTTNPDGATLPSFKVNYDCGLDTDGTTALKGFRMVSSGGTATVTGIPTGNSCSISEVAPTVITGYTWGTPVYDPDPPTIVIGSSSGTFTLTVRNSITRDRGSLKITKSTQNDDGATLPANFTGTYNCGVGYSGTWSIASPGGSQTISGIPTGNSCSITEDSLAAIPKYTWETPVISPSSIVISTKGGEFEITVKNKITRDRGRIIVIKNAKPAQGSFAFTTTGAGYDPFTLNGDPTAGNVNNQLLVTGTYTVKESTQLGWILTGIGGGDPVDPNDVLNTKFYCKVTVAGSNTSVGIGDLQDGVTTITLGKGDTVTCTYENTGAGVTRTQGFWATHSPLANIAWFGGSFTGSKPVNDPIVHTFPGVAATTGIGDTTLCSPVTKNISTLGALMGGFWSDISKTSAGKKRTSIDQSRMQLLQQLLAAELNASAFGSVPAGGSQMFGKWEAAYCTGTAKEISDAQGQAASFNSNGDNGNFTPGTSADSKNARAIANKPFWDSLP